MSSNVAHENLCAEIMLAVSRENLGRLFPYENGLYRLYQSHKPIRIGTPGVPDLIGFTFTGKFLGVEVKTGSGKLATSQINFRKICPGIFIEARSVEQVLSEIRTAL